MRKRELNRFWEREEPEIFESSGLQWKLYRLGGKLQIKRFSQDGKFQGITLDRRAIPPEAAQLVKAFINLSEEKEMNYSWQPQ